MDEPASALDPLATLKIEELMRELVEHHTIVIVTHNMRQAARVSDMTTFLSIDRENLATRTGILIEYGPTQQIFTRSLNWETEDYVSGRFGLETMISSQFTVNGSGSTVVSAWAFAICSDYR